MKKKQLRVEIELSSLLLHMIFYNKLIDFFASNLENIYYLRRNLSVEFLISYLELGSHHILSQFLARSTPFLFSGARQKNADSSIKQFH